MIDYAEALRDYEAWERRSKISEWKKYPETQFTNEIASMLKTYGYSADVAGRKNISIIYENEEEGRDAIFCQFYDRISLEVAQDFKKAMSRVNIHEGGIIISKTSFDNDAKSYCEANEIEMWTLDDVISWEKEIEKYAEENGK